MYQIIIFKTKCNWLIFTVFFAKLQHFCLLIALTVRVYIGYGTLCVSRDWRRPLHWTTERGV